MESGETKPVGHEDLGGGGEGWAFPKEWETEVSTLGKSPISLNSKQLRIP